MSYIYPRTYLKKGIENTLSIWSPINIEYPKVKNGIKAQLSDRKAIRSDFEAIGNDLRKAIAEYGR